MILNVSRHKYFYFQEFHDFSCATFSPYSLITGMKPMEDVLINVERDRGKTLCITRDLKKTS